MKIKFLILFCFTLLLSGNALSLPSYHAGRLSAFFSVCTFNSPEKGPYVETYLNVVGNSVKLVKDKGKFQGKVEVEMTFRQKDTVELTGLPGMVIKYHDIYNLLSPPIDDTLGLRPDFIDQQRIPLPNGDYELELKIHDKNSADPSFTAKRAVKIEFPKDKAGISDIELLASYDLNKDSAVAGFVKSGFTVVPLVSDYFPEEINTLKFYAEIYNTQAVFGRDPFVINYFVSSIESKYIAANLSGVKRLTPKDVCVILAELPVKDLNSGNYNLTLELRNKNNELLGVKQVFFQRSNKPVPQRAFDLTDLRLLDINNTFVYYITNKDTLKEYIQSLRPISSRLETDFEDNQLDIADLKYRQQFFYDFWSRRNSSNPEKAWMEYLQEVKKVNFNYSTRIAKGYETDRGRVYLQYGPPNSITREENEPQAYPYEIWHYYKSERQSNVRFLFYCREPASNIYVLLHSDAQGEIYNSRWLIDLYSRDTKVNLNNFDQEVDPDHTHDKAYEDWNNPK